MRITKYGHSCLLIEEAGARMLTDPGVFSSGFEGLKDLDAILITHQHQDHCVPRNIGGLLEDNPEAKVYADEGSAKILANVGVPVQAVKAGDELEVAGVKVSVWGEHHALVHQEIPVVPDVGYMIAGKLFYPGDALTVPEPAVEVLAIPLDAPWMKVSEGIEYLRAVKPKVAIPVHDAINSVAGRDMYVSMLKDMGGGVEVRLVPDGQSTEV